MKFNVEENNVLNAFLSGIQPILNKLEDDGKSVAEDLLRNGIYPSRIIFINYEKYLSLNDKRLKYIFDCIRSSINYNIDDIDEYFGINDLKTAYELYKTNNYKLCILLLIQIYNYICNSNFGKISGEERIEITKKLNYVICSLENNSDVDRLKEETKKFGIGWIDYYLFYPFICSNANNTLMGSNREKYSRYIYNRNAIIHGYNNEFDTEENCLRYFSIILNLYDVMKIYNDFLKKRGDLDE